MHLCMILFQFTRLPGLSKVISVQQIIQSCPIKTSTMKVTYTLPMLSDLQYTNSVCWQTEVVASTLV